MSGTSIIAQIFVPLKQLATAGCRSHLSEMFKSAKVWDNPVHWFCLFLLLYVPVNSYGHGGWSVHLTTLFPGFNRLYISYS